MLLHKSCSPQGKPQCEVQFYQTRSSNSKRTLIRGRIFYQRWPRWLNVAPIIGYSVETVLQQWKQETALALPHMMPVFVCCVWIFKSKTARRWSTLTCTLQGTTLHLTTLRKVGQFALTFPPLPRIEYSISQHSYFTASSQYLRSNSLVVWGRNRERLPIVLFLAAHHNGPGSKVSSEVSTDSNLTAVNFRSCDQITDVLPAVCTMDYIGSLL